MKILTQEEFTTELNKIVIYGANDIEISAEDMKIAQRGDFFVAECLGIDSEENSFIFDIEDVNQIMK